MPSTASRTRRAATVRLNPSPFSEMSRRHSAASRDAGAGAWAPRTAASAASQAQRELLEPAAGDAGRGDGAGVVERDAGRAVHEARCRGTCLEPGLSGREGAARQRRLDPHDQLAGDQRRAARAHEELVCRDGPLAARAHDAHRAAQREHGGAPVPGRFHGGDASADRPHVPHLRVADPSSELADERQLARAAPGSRLVVARGGADPHAAAVDRDACELAQPAYVDHDGGIALPVLHLRDEARPAREGDRVGPMLGKRHNRLVQAACADV